MTRSFFCALLALASATSLVAAPKTKSRTPIRKGAPKPATAQQVMARLQGAVLRPQFLLRDGRVLEAGTAFVARDPRSGRPILMTALHLLGPDGGNTRQIPISRVNSEVVQVRAKRFGSNEIVATARRCVSRTGFVGDGAYKDDCVAWQIDTLGKNTVPLALSTRDLKSAGEVAWIVGNTYEKSASGVRLYRGVGWLQSNAEASVRPEETFEVRGFSGAPILNRQGEVVGLVSASDSSNTTYGAPIGRVRRNIR